MFPQNLDLRNLERLDLVRTFGGNFGIGFLDMTTFIVNYDLGREDRAIAANRWLTEIFEPIMAMVPVEARGKLEPAELFHEILVHRWYLSERAGHEVGIFETARSYIDNVLTSKPDELVTADESDSP